ncbi:MAG: Calx-beta domain-containing protein [Microcystis panniformis]
MKVVGNYAYLADWTSGLQIIDISNPTNPILKGNYDTDAAYGVEVVGNYAYVADGSSGLQIIDISNPSNPTFLGNYANFGAVLGVQVVGNYAYLVNNGASSLQIIDISNPTNPILKGSYDDDYDPAFGLQVVGNYAYVADGESGLKIIDISNPTNPILKGSYDTSYAFGVQIVGNYAYVADWDSGLQIIDISNPTNPILKGNYYSSGQAANVQVIGNYAYLAAQSGGWGGYGLQIIDISNPTNPTIKGNYKNFYSPLSYAYIVRDVQVVGNYAYAAGSNSPGAGGLQIIDVSDFNNPSPLPSVTLAVSTTSVNEDGTTNLVYTFTRTGSTTSALTANYTVGGTATFSTDYTQTGAASYTATTGTVTFAAGSSTATVTVDPTPDTTVENNETVALTLASGTGYTVGTTTPVTGTITNDDTSVTLAVSPASVTEDGTTNLIYTFTRTGVTTNPLTVNYTVGGTATNGTDYASIPTSVTFAANSATATLTVDPTADTTVETDETVILTLASGTGYTVGTTTPVTGTITNDDFPSITLAVSPASVTEDGTTNLVYTFTRSGSTTNSLTVNYTLGGTATLNTDYTRTGTNNTVTFAANATTATVTVDPTPDTIVEPDETVILTLASGTGYTVGTTTAATGTITNVPATSVTSQLSINDITVVEGQNSSAILTVTVNNPNAQPITVNYTTAPIDATANVDYTSQTGTLTIAPNASTATISIPILNDNLNEPDEAFTVTLSNPVNATINPDEAIGQVIITDTLQSAITRTLPNNVENLRLIGTNNINGTGNASNNNITGNSGINQINGANGADTLTGGLGADTFIFQFGQSTISTSDRITDFAINSDKIDLLTQAGNATSAPSSFSRAANSTVTTLQNLVNQVFTDANGAITGNQELAVNSAALVQVTTGAIAGTYLVINDSTAGFQSSNDLLINITGFTGTLPALGSIPVGNFFV